MTLLSLLRNKELVLALGRPLDDEIDSNADDHLSIFDPDTRASITEHIEPLKSKVEDLKKNLIMLCHILWHAFLGKGTIYRDLPKRCQYYAVNLFLFSIWLYKALS